MEQAPHSVQALLRVLGPRERVAIALAAVISLLERLAIVAATFEAAGDHAFSAFAFTGALAAIFLLRSAVRSFLRVEVLARVVTALTAALVAHDVKFGGLSDDDTELALFDGLFASETLIGEYVPEILADVPACACMLAIACAALPARIVGEGGIAMAFGALAVFAARQVTAKNADRVNEAFVPVQDDLSTAVRGRIEIVASGVGERFLAAVEHKAQRWRTVSARASLVSFLAGRAPALALAITVGLVLVLDEGLRGTLAHGVLGRAAVLASTTPAFAGLARAWLEIGKSHARTRSIATLLERNAQATAGGEAPPVLPAVVSIDRVSFAYDANERRVIDELVAVWRPGEVLALTGPNGSGKSTLLALLLGLVQPSRGAISVAGKDLRLIDPILWRQRIGYLSQRPFLSDRSTVGDAMRLIAQGTDTTTLERSLREVKLWPVLLARSPSAPLDAKVSSLSAGEKQRLALARVLARQSPVLILDEPDANLDAEGLDLLVELLRDLSPGHMIAIAAHSPRLIKAADRVLHLGGADGACARMPHLGDQEPEIDPGAGALA